MAARALVGILLLVVSADSAPIRQATATGTIAIVGATVIPMTSNDAVLRDHTVLTDGGRIISIGPTSSVRVPSGATRVNGTGKFLIPGLADMHVHLEYFDDPAILGLFVANGVTTIRNMDGRTYLLDWKRRIATGGLAGPRIYTAGPLLDGNPPVRPDNTVVADATAARSAVDAQVGEGYDFVKVYSALSPEAYAAILDTARARGRKVAGHIPRAVGLDGVLAAGQLFIEHLADFAAAIQADQAPGWSRRYLAMPVDPAKMRSVAERLTAAGVWSVPTLIEPERGVLRDAAITELLQSEELRYIPADGRALWERQTRAAAQRMDEDDWKLIAAGRAHRMMLVQQFRAARVKLLAGTDTPNAFVVPGFSLHDELALLVEAGLSAGEALASATREAAAALDATDWGTIEEGKSADLVLIDGNPLQKISYTRAIAGVVRSGQWLDTGARNQKLQALRKP